jgi:TP901 family phage tail tape measure protein
LADRTVKVTLLAAANSYIADMKKAAGATKETGTEAEQAAARHREQSEAMREVGGAITAMGAIALVGVGLAVSKFVQFDQAISNVKAATQESASNMALLREAALHAGADTVFSATEAANAIEELGKAGLTTEQILNGGLDGALSLAAAGQLAVADAAQIAAIAVKQFNLEGEDVPHVADLLAAGAGKAVGDVKDLSDALGQAGLVANGAGQSIEDTTGVLAAFADAGLLGSDAGTSLKSAIIALQAPTDKSRSVMEKYNLSFYDANGQMLSFDQIAGQLKSNLSGLTDEQRNAALATIFGNDALRSANVLYNQGAEGIRKYIDQTNDSGYAAKVAADRLDNLAGDVERLGGALDTALIRSGSGLNDSLRSLTQGVTGLVDGIGSLPEPVLGGAAALTGLVGIVALTGGTALVAIPKIAQFKLALSTLNVSGASAAKGIGLATGALAAAGIAFSIWSARQAEATANAAEFKSSLDQTTGAVTNYTRELAAQKLAQAGVFETGREVGLSQKEILDALIEGGQKYADVQKRLTENNTFASAFTGLAFRAGNAQTALRDLSGDIERGKQDLDDQAAAAEGSASSTEKAGDAYAGAAVTAEDLEQRLREVIDAVNELNGVNQSAETTNARWLESLAGISAEVQRQKDAFQEANGTLDGFSLSLDKNTLAGATNRASLADVAGAAQTAAKAQLDAEIAAGLGAQAATNYANTLTAQKDAFIKAATEAGYSEDAVREYADQVFALPDSKTLDLIANTASAARTIEDFKNRYGTIQGVINYRAVTTDGAVGGRASGGIIPGAPSERDNRIYALATGEFVVRAREVAKPENRRLLEAMNAGMLKGYATGGYVQPQYASSSPRVSVTTASAPVQFPSQIVLALEDGTQLRGYVQNAAADVVRNTFSGDQGGMR